MRTRSAITWRDILIIVALCLLLVVGSLTIQDEFATATHTVDSPLTLVAWGLTLASGVLLYVSRWGVIPSLMWLNPFMAVAVNLAFSTVMYNADLPFYFDTIGTMFIAIIYGPVWGMSTALFTAAMASLYAPSDLAFVPVGVAVAIFIGTAAQREKLTSVSNVMITGLLTGVLAGLLALSPAFAKNAVGLNISSGDLTAFYRMLVHNDDLALVMQSLTSDPLDKALSLLLVCFCIRNNPRFIRRLYEYRGTEEAIGRVLSDPPYGTLR
ncbi:hypothetical protein [Corynebacterium sp.]|uniref:hypothetical protein n=1 Tax=Corynebacterium sp. TaxID=1720 RepID=UPI0026DCBB7C|nr:hypothetical protein [Corynebacterium sp.]MDO5032007.1 hypothetical protein [Corynebacterium sp.]